MPGIYNTAKESFSQADLARLACCLLHTKGWQQAIDWESAAKDYDPKILPASFKTVTPKLIKKLEVAAGEGKGKEDVAGQGKGNGVGKKRKGADEDGGRDDEGEKPGKKIKAEVKKAKAKGNVGDGAIKAENNDSSDEDAF